MLDADIALLHTALLDELLAQDPRQRTRTERWCDDRGPIPRAGHHEHRRYRTLTQHPEGVEEQHIFQACGFGVAAPGAATREADEPC